MKAKALLSAALTAAILLTMPACSGHVSNGLLKDASPATSALALYVYDGESVSRGFLFGTEEVEDVLNRLDAVEAKPVEDWSPSEVTTPIYGLEIGGKSGETLHAAWTGGRWITEDGSVYDYSFDFDSLRENENWEEWDDLFSTALLPCARYLMEDENGWNPALLTKAEALDPPEDVTMTLESWDGGEVTVTFQNSGDAEWTYGEYFGLQVLLEGEWYEVPAAEGDYAFIDIAYILPAGERQSKTYSLSMYGDLPAGTYRLTVEGMSVEQTIE